MSAPFSPKRTRPTPEENAKWIFSPGSACTLIVVAGGIPGARFIVSVAQSQGSLSKYEINYSQKNFHYFLSLTRPPYVLIISRAVTTKKNSSNIVTVK